MSGFTLIELLVVIIILAILAAVVIPRVLGRTDDARIAKATADVSTLESTLEMYKADNRNYPTGDQGLQALIANVENSPKWNGPYVKTLPMDPWGNPYVYVFPPQHSADFDIFSAGPDGQPGTEDDIGNWNLQK